MIIEKSIPVLDLDDNIAVGLKFPLTNNSNNFFALNYTTFEQAKDNLLMLLSTKVGERIYQPEYGTNLHRIIFDNEDNFEENITAELEQKITEFLPYINISDLTINFNQNDQVINIDLTYGVKYDPELSDTVSFNLIIN